MEAVFRPLPTLYSIDFRSDLIQGNCAMPEVVVVAVAAAVAVVSQFCIRHPLPQHLYPHYQGHLGLVSVMTSLTSIYVARENLPEDRVVPTRLPEDQTRAPRLLG